MRRQIITAVMAALLPAIAMAQAPARSAPIMPPPRVGDPGTDGVRLDKDGVFANFFPRTLTGHSRHPAILLLGGSESGLGAGGGGFIKALTGQGYDVLYLCYFGCPGTPPQLAAVPLETFDRGLAFLRAQPGVDPNKVAVVGGSKGGEAALLVATRDRRLRAVVAGMPSSVAWPRVSTTAATQPSWTVGGASVPFLPYSFASFAKGGVFGLYNGALPSVAQHPDAVIPVERITGPILLVCGEADSLGLRARWRTRSPSG